MDNTLGVQVIEAGQDLCSERLGDVLFKASKLAQAIADRSTGNVLEEARKLNVNAEVQPGIGDTYMLRRVDVCSKPKSRTILRWSRSCCVSLSSMRALTTFIRRASLLSFAVRGISTCFTAIISPRVTFIAKWTHVELPVPINFPRIHLKTAVINTISPDKKER
jgi:hypothetical protein